MRQFHIEKRKARQPYTDDPLPTDPRDPDIARAKAIARLATKEADVSRWAGHPRARREA